MFALYDFLGYLCVWFDKPPLFMWATGHLVNVECSLTDGSVAGDWRPKCAFSLLNWRTFSSALPAGHLFVNISGGQYWTSTTIVEQTPTPCPNHACEVFVVSFFSWGIFSDAKIGDN